MADPSWVVVDFPTGGYVRTDTGTYDISLTTTRKTFLTGWDYVDAELLGK